MIITNGEDSKIPQIGISPAYDLDVSFNLAQELSTYGGLYVLKTDSGELANISAFIQEFQDVPDFKQFLTSIYNKIQRDSVAEEIVYRAYKDTKFNYFSKNHMRYITFLKNRFEQIRICYEKTFMKDKGEIIK